MSSRSCASIPCASTRLGSPTFLTKTGQEPHWLLGSFDPAGEVILAEDSPSATQRIERAPKHACGRMSDFASRITFGEGCLKGLVIWAVMQLSHF